MKKSACDGFDILDEELILFEGFADNTIRPMSPKRRAQLQAERDNLVKQGVLPPLPKNPDSPTTAAPDLPT